ncbi:MAG TPA: hypothetical protein VHX92_04715 [Rhizomicrobium sp.]|nr:hypothetical protein [Rhizomicrobium sp.]
MEKGRHMKLWALAAFSLLFSLQAEAAQLDCNTGPVTKTYGGVPWLVYACNDGRSLTFVSAPGNSAMPFYFLLGWKDGKYQLSGEGTGDRTVTDAASRQISALGPADISRLLAGPWQKAAETTECYFAGDS